MSAIGSRYPPSSMTYSPHERITGICDFLDPATKLRRIHNMDVYVVIPTLRAMELCRSKTSEMYAIRVSR
jgi:hypothetical protein